MINHNKSSACKQSLVYNLVMKVALFFTALLLIMLSFEKSEQVPTPVDPIETNEKKGGIEWKCEDFDDWETANFYFQERGASELDLDGDGIPCETKLKIEQDLESANNKVDYDSGRRTFGSYNCTDDCSGHAAGYNWAASKGIYDPEDCGGNSLSFIEGCLEYTGY